MTDDGVSRKTRRAAQPNRGPAAAAGNRAALVAAARRVFAERGYQAPLSAIAKEAGVGQGVLYRHFPDRLHLAIAAFEAHWTDYESLSADPEPTAFARLWALIVRRTIDEAAFVEMAVDARGRATDYDGAERLLALLEPALRRGQEAGIVDPSLTADDVMLAQRMVYGIVVTSVDGDVDEQVARALARLPWLPAAPD